MSTLNQILALVQELQLELEMYQYYQSGKTVPASNIRHHVLHPAQKPMELYQRILQRKHAKTIQTAFRASFIIYQPREYVGGDFFWAVQLSKKVVIIMGDCVGHGILGATGQFFMMTLLSELFIENPDLQVGELVRKMHKLVKECQEEEGHKNFSIDLTACIIEPETQQIRISGLHQEALFFRNGEMTRFQGRPGKLKAEDVSVYYQEHCMKYFPGDRLYFFTDGYYDQFGGPQGRKFMRRRFYEKLASIQDLDLATQKENLEDTMRAWMYDYEEQEQIDDMLIIGLAL